MSITVIFVIILFASLFLGSLFHPIWGIVGYVCIYSFFNPDLWWCKPIADILSRPSFVSMAFLGVGALLHNKKLKWRISAVEFAFYLFLASLWITSLFFGVGVDPEGERALVKMAKMFVFIFILLRVVHTLDTFKLFQWGLIFGGFFLAFQAHEIGQFYDGRLENIGGIDFTEANSLGLFMVCTAILLGFEIMRAPLWAKILLIGAIGAIIDTLVLTRSRAGFLALVIPAPYVLVGIPKKFRKQIYIYVLMGGVAVLMLSDAQFLGRVGTIQDEIDVQSNAPDETSEIPLSRLDFWKASIPMFKDHLLGVGVTNFKRVVTRYDPRNRGMSAHSTYVTCYAETGIIGMALFLYIICSGFLLIRKSRQIAVNELKDEQLSIYGMAIATVMLAHLIGGATTHTYLYHEFTWMILSMPICYHNAVLGMLADAETNSGHLAKSAHEFHASAEAEALRSEEK